MRRRHLKFYLSGSAKRIRSLYSRIKRQDYKTPDYAVYFSEHLVIAEVKQLNPNEADEKHRKQGWKRGWITYWEESGHRVRLKINDAKKQLKLGSQGKYPAILVLYDNIPIRSIDSDDIKTATYGHESVRMGLPNDHEGMLIKIMNVGFGSDRKFTPRDNTTFSAIGLLYKFGGTLHLSFFHNIHAKCPIDPSWLRRGTVRHFTLGSEIQGTFQEWLEI